MFMPNGFKSDIKSQVLSKTNGHCAYCGEKINSKSLTIDHVHPRCLGGENDIDNYLPACSSCNVLKAHKSVDEFKEEIMNEMIKAIHKNKYLSMALKLNLINIDDSFRFHYEAEQNIDEMELFYAQLRILKHDNHLLRQNVDLVKDQENRELKEEVLRLKKSFHDEMTKDRLYQRQKEEIDALREHAEELKELINSSYNTYLILQSKNMARKYAEGKMISRTKIVDRDEN